MTAASVRPITSAPSASVKTAAAATDMGKTFSDLRAYYARNIKEQTSNAQIVRERAQSVYLGIKMAKSTREGVNKMMAARRQKKALLRAAALNEAAAKAWMVALGMLNHDFMSPDNQHVRTKGFDMSK